MVGFEGYHTKLLANLWLKNGVVMLKSQLRGFFAVYLVEASKNMILLKKGGIMTWPAVAVELKSRQGVDNPVPCKI